MKIWSYNIVSDTCSVCVCVSVCFYHSKKLWFSSCRTSIMCSTCSSATTNSFSGSSSSRWWGRRLTRMAADHQLTPSINSSRRRRHRRHTAMLIPARGQRRMCPNRRARRVFQMACRNQMLLMLPFHRNLLMKMTQMLVSSTWCVCVLDSLWRSSFALVYVFACWFVSRTLKNIIKLLLIFGKQKPLTFKNPLALC